MADALTSSIIDALLTLELGATDRDVSNRVSLDGVTLRSNDAGALEIGIRTFEALSLRLASGPFVVEVGRLALRELVGHVDVNEGVPRLRLLEAAEAELSDVKVHGPLTLSQEARQRLHELHAHGSTPVTVDADAADAWNLGPLADADGRIRAEIIDAHLVFDADVTVPIRRGRIDFNEATVEHVGPDSRMGVSRLGIYVDAPNGRSYVYQFSLAPIAGVEFEQRSAFLGAWVANRGNLRLQPFAEGLLRQAACGTGAGFTEETRLLFDRTALSGEVQLSDGKFAAPGLEAHLVGRADRRNAIRLHSQAVGRGLTAEMTSLAVRHAVLRSGHTRFNCDELTGALALRVLVRGSDLSFALDVAQIKLAGLRVTRDGAG